MAADSKSSVVAALFGNTVIMIAKFVAFFVTGSGAMFAEAIHTLADVGNQALLLLGIVRSGREPNEVYNYGHGQERFVWALISAVGIFFLGCGVTLAHGIEALIHPEEMPPHDLTWALGVLGGSLLIEGYVFVYAFIGLKKTAAGRPFAKFLRDEADPAAVAVLLEDFAACLGVVLALASIGLTKLTGEAYWDSIGSILIGLLLGGVAIWLTFRNRELLIGRAAPKKARLAIRKAIESMPSVEGIVRLKSRVIDTETYDVLVELEFDGEKLAEQFEDELKARWDAGFEDFEAFYAFEKKFADDVVELLGDKVDTIEKKISAAVPEVKQIDVEPD